MSKYSVKVKSAYTYIKPRTLRDSLKDIKKVKDYSLWFLTNGQGEIKIGNEIVIPEIGECFLLTPGLEKKMCSNNENPFIPLVISFKSSDNITFSFHRKKFEDPFFFREILNRILSAHQQKDHDAENDWLNVALMELLDKDVKEVDIFHGRKFEYISEINHICTKIKKYPEKKWNIEQFAKDIFISKQHFFRLFKEQKKCSPQQFITKAKMKKAERLLTYSAYGITEISHILGYTYKTQFFRDFKKNHNMTAKEFRDTSSKPKPNS